MRSKKQRGVKGEGGGEQRGTFIGGVYTKIEPGPFSKYLRGDTVESLNMSQRCDCSQPRDSIGVLSLFVWALPSSAPPHLIVASFLAPIRNPVLPLLTTPHSPQPTRPSVLRRLPIPAQPDIRRLISRLVFRTITQVATFFP